MSSTGTTWDNAISRIIDASHLVTGDRLSELVDEVLRPLGLSAELLVVDLAQRWLLPVRPEPGPSLEVDTTLAGRAYQFGEILAGTDDDGVPLLWVPMIDGTDRAGLLRVGLGPSVQDDAALRRWCWSLSGALGHIVISKFAYTERLRWLRSNGPLSVAAELVWSLLPPRTFATDRLVVTGEMQPWDRVAGDAYDYAVNAGNAYLAVFDGVGHDLRASQTTALAVAAIRQARRGGVTDLADLAARADALLAAQPGAPFVTAVLASLDTDTGELRYVLAGHPPPLLVRDGHAIRELGQPPRLPLGVSGSSPSRRAVGHERLEPGDRLVLYSDGVTEARSADGAFFGEHRLVDFIERAELARLPAPETLRRLTAAVLAHQGGRLQDDATLLLVEWSAEAHRRLLPSLD